MSDRSDIRPRFFRGAGVAVLAWLLLTGAPLRAGAQSRDALDLRRGVGSSSDRPFPASVQAPEGTGEDGSMLGLAKWSTLALSAGASVYGFWVNSQAEDQFEQIEAICSDDPGRCRSRQPDGSFSDPELESRYQEVLDKDQKARAALIVAQVGLAASVVLFILDLDGSETPPDIPFDPPRISVSPDRAQISYSVTLPFH